MAAFVNISRMPLLGTAWTGTAPGLPGTQTISGTITSTSDISTYVVGGGDFGWTTAQEPTTNHGSGGYVTTIPGLTSGDDLVFDCNSDAAAAALDVIIRTTLGGVSRAGSSPIYVDLKPTSAARGATNPSLVAACFITKWSPWTGNVGARAAASLTLTITGAFGYLTS